MFEQRHGSRGLMRLDIPHEPGPVHDLICIHDIVVMCTLRLSMEMENISE